MSVIRLFNEEAGREFLSRQGISDESINQLSMLGISSVGNVICAIKFAKYFELTSRDIILTVWTDSMELYGSRVREMRESRGEYREPDAVKDFHRHLMGLKTDSMLELSYYDRLRIHNLKYFTWVEQQGRSPEELRQQWYDYPDYWDRVHGMVPKIDQLISDFNEQVKAM